MYVGAPLDGSILPPPRETSHHGGFGHLGDDGAAEDTEEIIAPSMGGGQGFAIFSDSARTPSIDRSVFVPAVEEQDEDAENVPPQATVQTSRAVSLPRPVSVSHRDGLACKMKEVIFSAPLFSTRQNPPRPRDSG